MKNFTHGGNLPTAVGSPSRIFGEQLEQRLAIGHTNGS